MATFRKVSRLVPSSQRSTSITDVEAGDQIDVKAILGRPARQIKIVPGDSSDLIEVRLNNRVVIPTYYDRHKTTQPTHLRATENVEFVSAGAHYPVYEMTGSDAYYTEEGLAISFIEIVDITFGGSPATAPEIEVW